MQQVGIKRASGRRAWWETGMEEEQRPLEERQLELEEECCLLVLYRDPKLLPISPITSPCFHLYNIMTVISLRLCNLICKTNWAGLDHHNLFQVVSNILVVSNIHSHLLSPHMPHIPSYPPTQYQQSNQDQPGQTSTEEWGIHSESTFRSQSIPTT